MKLDKWGLSIALTAALALAAIYFSVFKLLASNLGDATAGQFLNNHLAGSAASVENEISFAFAGDVMLGRNVGYDFQKNNFKEMFKNFDASIFSQADIAWLNLEGPISGQVVKQNPEAHSLVFNFSRQAVEALKSLKISLVGLANNHADNQG